MPTRLLLISDTHVPARARRLPDEVWRAVDEADLVVHAGDWVDVATLDALVFGHSHIPWDSTTLRGIRLVNPGSPTDPATAACVHHDDRSPMRGSCARSCWYPSSAERRHPRISVRRARHGHPTSRGLP